MNAHRERVAVCAGELPLTPSRRLAAILLAGHAAVAVLLVLLDMAAVWKAAALALVCASLVLELRVALHAGARAVTALQIAVDDGFSIRTRGGGWQACEVLGSTYVTAWLTVLNLRVGGARRIRSVVILADSMAADDFRRLRTWLRWRAQGADA
jgi:toxin CptA